MRRSGDDSIEPENYTENEHGFGSYTIAGNELTIVQCYGDGAWWDAEFTRLAKANNCTHIVFATQRNPKTFARKFGYKTMATVMTKEVT